MVEKDIVSVSGSLEICSSKTGLKRIPFLKITDVSVIGNAKEVIGQPEYFKAIEADDNVIEKDDEPDKMLLIDQMMGTEEIEQIEKSRKKDNESDQMLLIDFDASICKDPEQFVPYSHGILDSSLPPNLPEFSADLMSLDLPTITVTPPGDVPAGIDEETDKSVNLPTITVTPPGDVSAAFDTKSVNHPTITVTTPAGIDIEGLTETSSLDSNAKEKTNLRTLSVQFFPIEL